MKIRIGFVSNSSSSSFVMVGIESTPEIIETLKKKAVYKDSIYDIANDLDLFIYDSYIGICFTYGDSDENNIIDETIVPFKDLNKNQYVKRLLDLTEKSFEDLNFIAGTQEN